MVRLSILTKLACTGLEPLSALRTFDTLEVNATNLGRCNHVRTLRTGSVECGMHFGKVYFLLLRLNLRGEVLT